MSRLDIGASRYYYCVVSATGVADQNTNHASGYIGVGTLTFQWYSSTSSGGSYSAIGGATTPTYNDSTAAPAPTITVGTASASAGTSTSQVQLSVAGYSGKCGGKPITNAILMPLEQVNRLLMKLLGILAWVVLLSSGTEVLELRGQYFLSISRGNRQFSFKRYNRTVSIYYGGNYNSHRKYKFDDCYYFRSAVSPPMRVKVDIIIVMRPLLERLIRILIIVLVILESEF